MTAFNLSMGPEGPKSSDGTAETSLATAPAASEKGSNADGARGTEGDTDSAAAIDSQLLASNTVPTASPTSQPRSAVSGTFDKKRLKSAFASALISKSRPSPSRPTSASPKHTSFDVQQTAQRSGSETPISSQPMLHSSPRKPNRTGDQGLPPGAKLSSSDHDMGPTAQASEFPTNHVETQKPKRRASHTYVLPNGEVVHSGKGLGRGRPGIKRGPKKSRAAPISTTPTQPESRKRRRVSGDDDIGQEVESPAGSGSLSDSENEYSPQATQTRSGRHTQRPTTFVPPESPSQKKPRIATSTSSLAEKPLPKRKVYKRKEQSALCEHCLRGYGPVKNAIVFCDGCDRCWHQRCHDPVIPRKLVLNPSADWFCFECATGNTETAERKSTAQTVESAPVPEPRPSSETLRRAHFETLPKEKLIDLLMQASAAAPEITLWNDLLIIQPPLPLPLSLPPPSPHPTPSESNPTSDPNLWINTTHTIASHVDQNQDQQQKEQQQHQQDSETDDSPILENDHALLYPKPGNGVHLPPESEDLNMLLEGPQCRTFSHWIRQDVMPVSLAVSLAVAVAA